MGRLEQCQRSRTQEGALSVRACGPGQGGKTGRSLAARAQESKWGLYTDVPLSPSHYQTKSNANCTKFWKDQNSVTFWDPYPELWAGTWRVGEPTLASGPLVCGAPCPSPLPVEPQLPPHQPPTATVINRAKEELGPIGQEISMLWAPRVYLEGAGGGEKCSALSLWSPPLVGRASLGPSRALQSMGL